MEPTAIIAQNQVLVEGNDTRNFVTALLSHLQIPGHMMQVQNFGGVNELGSYLLAFRNMPDFESVARIGIMRDAEVSAVGAFQSVQNSLRRAGLPVPVAVNQPGTGHPEITTLILPGNDRDGMLETLLCETFLDSPVNACIDDFFACIPNGLSTKSTPKARAQVWIATKARPEVSVGVAAQRGYWDLDHSSLKLVRDFCRVLSRAN